MIELLIANMVLLIGVAYFLYKSNRMTSDRWIDVMVKAVGFDNIDLSKSFSQDVVELYTDILKNVDSYTLTTHALEKQGSDISIWAANEMNSRRFYTHNKEQKEKVNEMNEKLTHADKMLLDRLVIAYREKQNKMVTKFFI